MENKAKRGKDSGRRKEMKVTISPVIRYTVSTEEGDVQGS